MTELIVVHMVTIVKGVFKGGGVQGVQTPPKNFQIFFLKSEGKEIERKRKKRMLGGGLHLNIFLGFIFFRVGFRNFHGVETFSGGGGLRNFRGGLRNFRGG